LIASSARVTEGAIAQFLGSDSRLNANTDILLMAALTVRELRHKRQRNLVTRLRRKNPHSSDPHHSLLPWSLPFSPSLRERSPHMSFPVIVDSYVIDSLKRKARAARLQACRASPTLEVQLKSLATLYEADAERMVSVGDSMVRF
jgi:hypothetical protein